MTSQDLQERAKVIFCKDDLTLPPIISLPIISLQVSIVIMIIIVRRVNFAREDREQDEGTKAAARGGGGLWKIGSKNWIGDGHKYLNRISMDWLFGTCNTVYLGFCNTNIFNTSKNIK